MADAPLSSNPKLWYAFKAARYKDGVLIEEYDHGVRSDLPQPMVEFSEYERLRVALENIVIIAHLPPNMTKSLGHDADLDNAIIAARELLKGQPVESRSDTDHG